jgi:hypothetical protein
MVYVGYGRLHKDCHIVDTNFHKPGLAIFANILQLKISAKWTRNSNLNTVF